MMNHCFIFSLALSIFSPASCTGPFDVAPLVSRTTSFSGNRHLLKKRIVGGDRVEIGEFPFLALTKGRHVCGATLIHPDILLTAGHCGEFFGEGVTIGGILLDGSDGEFHIVDQVYIHEDYPGSGAEPHDIALVRLSTKSSIRPAKLAQWPDMPVENGWVTAVGFGDVADGGPISQYALKASLRVSNFEACNAKYGKVIKALMFCTDTPNYDKDTCQGDSGGPLVNGSGAVVGIVFFGSGCAEYGSPSVNTRVAAYLQWINKGICALSNEKPDLCFTSAPLPLPSKSSIRSPTKSPVRSPTKPPVRPSTNSPLQPPTKSPIRSPTKSPIRSPTKSPIRSPTKSPIRSPTSSPVRQPTKSPVRQPTKSPVRQPTKSPVRQPTKSPVRQPTKFPVLPTKFPVLPPTKSPVRPPTKSPVRPPTKSPVRPLINPFTEVPTKAPKKVPTKPATQTKVETPTKTPARSPVLSITAIPVPLQRRSPTRLPVNSQTSISSVQSSETKEPAASPANELSESPNSDPVASLRTQTSSAKEWDGTRAYSLCFGALLLSFTF